MTNVVTVDELRALRRRRAELGSVVSRLQELGHLVPAAVATELDALDGAVVDVVIRCLLCGAFGTYATFVDDDGGGDVARHAAVCRSCDRAVFQDAFADPGV
jgi:hypothetical protein